MFAHIVLSVGLISRVTQPLNFHKWEALGRWPTMHELQGIYIYI